MEEIMRAFCAWLPVAVLVLAGCSAQPSATTGKDTQTSAQTGGTRLPEPAPGAGIEMKKLSYAEYEELIAKHKGKFVIVDFWIDTCIPCKKAMPHLIELQKKHPQNLVIITMNMDDPKEQERGLAFLRSAQITLPNYAFDAGEAWIANWKELATGIVYPHTRIYDREGKLIHDETTTQEELAEKVAELLKK
jgi:thiol-disulfide isomerase/thioredoxin